MIFCEECEILAVAVKDQENLEWVKDFEAAAKRGLNERMAYAFIYTYKPVLDDEPFRAFDTIKDYQEWCQGKLPSWLGYGKTL